jgi:RNA polymerase sigma-70 factor (ECF subfamily)
MPSKPPEAAERLTAQERRLRLLLAHLSGPAVRARVDGDDLLQETWLRALESAERWPPHEPGDAALGRWLAHVARHVVIDAARALRALKRDGREERLERSDWTRAGARGAQLLARSGGPPTRLSALEGERALLAAFERLAPEHRRVLGLRQFEGLSAREAARRMGRSEAALHSLYRRALAAWEEGLAGKPALGGESAGRPRLAP